MPLSLTNQPPSESILFSSLLLMMAAVETPCVWIITDRSIFGISVEKLLRLGKEGHKIEWNNLPSVPSLFDFCLDDLPEIGYNPLLYDSNIFLASYSGDIYHLQFDKKQQQQQLLLQVSKVPPESIPSLPITEIQDIFFANTGGKVYFLAFDSEKWMRQDPLPEGFWVLDPAIGKWRSLDYPIPIGDQDFLGSRSMLFTLHNKLLFEPRCISERQNHLYCFDTQTEKWKKLSSDSQKVDDGLPPFESCPISLALPNRDLTVALTWTGEGNLAKCRVKLRALLLDSSKGNSIVFYQQLDELYEGFQEDLYLGGTSLTVKILDIGKGLVCALVTGVRYDYGSNCDRSYLWVIVFSLSLTTLMIPLLEDDEKERKPGTFWEGKPGKFLDVELHSNRLLFFPCVSGYGFIDQLHHAFFTDYATSHDYNKGTTSSPPRKQLKLDSD